jgi:PAS domain S-box-containing protein
MQLNLEEIVAQRTADLAQSEAKYRGLVDNAMVGVFATTLDGQFIFINDAMAKMFDFDTPEQMISQGSLERWRDQKDRERILVALQKHGSVTNFEAETITHTDRHIHVLFSAKQVDNDIVGMVMDITERKHAEEKIISYQKRLQALASQLALVEEKERRRIAIDLHDHVGQSLALARVQIASAHKFAAEPTLADMLDEISNTLLEAIGDTQQLMLELSSHSMHGTGLSSAISNWLEGEIRPRHRMKTEVIDNVGKNRRKALDPNMETILFRNVRELVINVVKHARADKVSVRLEDRGASMRIIVEDDGIGFDPRAVVETGNKIGGFGLFSIKELMTDLGGDLKIVSEPGKGCSAIMSTPFKVDDSRRRD